MKTEHMKTGQIIVGPDQQRWRVKSVERHREPHAICLAMYPESFGASYMTAVFSESQLLKFTLESEPEDDV